jgi:hypothetical protein
LGKSARLGKLGIFGKRGRTSPYITKNPEQRKAAPG